MRNKYSMLMDLFQIVLELLNDFIFHLSPSDKEFVNCIQFCVFI